MGCSCVGGRPEPRERFEQRIDHEPWIDTRAALAGSPRGHLLLHSALVSPCLHPPLTGSRRRRARAAIAGSPRGRSLLRRALVCAWMHPRPRGSRRCRAGACLVSVSRRAAVCASIALSLIWTLLLLERKDRRMRSSCTQFTNYRLSDEARPSDRHAPPDWIGGAVGVSEASCPALLRARRYSRVRSGGQSPSGGGSPKRKEILL